MPFASILRNAVRRFLQPIPIEIRTLDVAKRERRLMERRQMSMPGGASGALSGLNERIQIRNMSEQGLYFLGDSQPLIGASIRIIVADASDPSRLLRYQTRIVRVEEVGDKFGIAAVICRRETLV